MPWPLKFVVWFFVMLGLAQPAHPADDVDEPAQAAAARAILEDWQKSHANRVERSLHIVCWTPSDREFPRAHQERMSRMLLHIQAFYSREMERNGFGSGSIRLQLNPDGGVVLHEVRGTYPAARYGKKSGRDIREECVPILQKVGIDADKETIAIFCNLATWDEKGLRFSHESPYYAGGTYRQGTAWQLDSPELDTLNLPRTEPTIEDGEYGRISLGKHNSIFIGGMAHELGHALGLPHCRQRPDEASLGNALMGAGNRTYGDEIRNEGKGSFLTFTHALRLASHPQFCGLLESESTKPRSSVTGVKIRPDGKGIVVSGTVQGEPPIYGLAAYFDPEGNDDYNAASTSGVPRSDGRFEIRCDALVPGKGGVLRLIPLHANGAIADEGTLHKLRFPYRVGEDGVPDLRTIQLREALQPIVEALGKPDPARARRLAGDLKSREAAAIAAKLVRTAPPQQTPAELRGTARRQSLTALKPEAAEVGWNRPAFDRIPDASLLLESGGDLYATGIYAHAPARHEYALGGRWGSLSGRVGLATGHQGSVVFQIQGDGRTLWESAVIKEGRTVPFEVDLGGIQKLELFTLPTDDGSSSDWGLWLEPELRRAER